MKTIKPQPLQKGDTVALVNVAGAIYAPEKYDITHQILQNLGLKVKESATLRETYGYLAGTDQMRADALHQAFADPEVKAILAMRGGFGCTRILDKIDYQNIQSNPKIFCGFSDITALHSAIFTHTGLMTFHSPVGTTLNDKTSLMYFQKMLFGEKIESLKNPQTTDFQILYPQKTIYSGKAQGTLIGGNLTLLTTLLGTKYTYHYDQKILFIEEINEAIYRIDRMFSQLKLAGILEMVSGIIIGQFTDCESTNKAHFSLAEILDFYLKPLQKPVFRGAMVGHSPQSYTLPIGAKVELDADNFCLHFVDF